MDNKCNAVHVKKVTGNSYRCGLDTEHVGDHKTFDWYHGFPIATWRNPCLQENSNFTCSLVKGHSGDHEAHGSSGQVYRTWQHKIEPFKIEFIRPTEKQHSVQFSLEELKGLVYALSGPEWLEDEPELVAKIDKALKEAL